ncbi:MAG TPA: thioredoxin domain-containing protein [Candidatus Acidoferrales bacterium]|nr:thioredoxin domain-containing protein [Candidatus Acidoferrales bacterium]
MASGKNSTSNRLISEKSPYLLQHAHNPVDWYPWGPEAFQKAREEDKPVFLSIGYSACHWCHVMERESFEDPEVARMLNEAFVCIKVDREERPDLDAAYMKVCQAMTGTGGWPLHIIMTADKKPFFAATYIPKENRFGQVGMKQLVPQIKQFWALKRKELIDSGEKIEALLKGRENESSLQPTEELVESTLDEAYLHLAENFDERYGGFGTSPKFPSPHNLSFLLRYWKRTRHDKALQMVEKTLDAMRLGGIYDQLGFGFHRYSTDAKWLVPHFEKMLYDQAMLVTAYTEAYQVTGKEDYRQTVHEVITYILRNMTDSNGGFYSAEDADSEGEEGKFYLWTEREIRQALSQDEAELVKKVFGTEEGGNFVEAITGKETGKNILHLRKPLAELAVDLHVSPEKLEKLMEEARLKLLAARQKRVHPSIDDKILTDWNGLMIVALAEAGRVFDEPEYLAAARKAADFIIGNLFDAEGKLLHRYRQGEARIEGFLDDYAFFTWGLVELYEAVFETKYLRYAIDLADEMLAHFWDKELGGFYQTADYSEAAFLRSKGIYDGAYPSGNSAAALDLVYLARMTGETRFEEKAAQLMRAFSTEVTKEPSAHAQLMSALDFALGPSSEVVVVGDPQKEDTARMLKTLWSKFLPRKVVILCSTAKPQEIADIAKFIENMHGEGDKAAAFVCRGHVCNLPTTDVRIMLELLNER